MDRVAYSRVEVPPSPADSGLSLEVLRDAGDLFPNAPFSALVWPVQELPQEGVNACFLDVTEVDLDTFTFTRRELTIPITRDLQIAVSSLQPVYQPDATVRISAAFPDGGTSDAGVLRTLNPQGRVTEYRVPDITIDGPGEYHLDLDASTSGMWFTRWTGPNEELTITNSFFVPFTEI